MQDQPAGHDNALASLMLLIHRSRIGVAIVFVLGLAATLAVATLTRPVYRSQAVITVTSTSENGGFSSMLGQLGGLATLAGVDLPMEGGLNRNEAVAVLSSRAFSRRFIEAENLLPILFEDDWNDQSNEWRSEDPMDVPTLGDGVKKFEEQVRRVNMDEATGIVTVSVDWHDRELAAQWANKLVASANNELRERAIAEAQRSLNYLEQEAAKTSVTQIRDAIYSLVETQVKTIMLANVREEYAFKVLDPAIASDEDKPVWPKPILIVGLGIIFSVLLAIGWALASATVGKLRSDYRESVKLR